MGDKIIICGGNGAGKSTLGRALARATGYRFADIEDYYFPDRDRDYVYGTSRSRAEVQALLLKDLKKYPNFILSAVKGNYGEEVTAMFTRAVLICVPKEIRMKRVWDRSFRKFGDRILPEGDLYESESRFFEAVERRSEHDVTAWLGSVKLPVLQIDGTRPTEESVREIVAALKCGR